MGTNEADIAFSGTSEGEGVSLNLHLTLDAKVMDIELYNGSTVVDLTGEYGGTSTNLGGLGFARLYFGVTDPKIKNIGNVDIDVPSISLFGFHRFSSSPCRPWSPRRSSWA